MGSRNLLRSETAGSIYRQFAADERLQKQDPDTIRESVFFYIGRNRSRILELAGACGKGFTAENTASAMSVLSRLIACNTAPEPEIDFILADADAAGALEKFQHYLVSSGYGAVPLVLELAASDGASLSRYRNCTYVDDIISPEQPVNRILARMAVIKKLKAIPARVLEAGLETGYPWRSGLARAKRLADFCFALAVILLAGPVFILIAGLIWLESGGPVLSVTDKVGRGFRVFHSYTFRTLAMAGGRKLQPALHHARGTIDPILFRTGERQEFTHVGSMLRKTGLEQMPQLFNVLLGDISVKGGHPLTLERAATLTSPEEAGSLMEPVGLTGSWRNGDE